MILKSTDPWANFLHARALVIRYLIKEGKSYHQVAHILSMDWMQVQLISMTEIEE